MDESLTKQYRYFLKDSVRKTIDFSRTDQSQKLSPPPIEKPFPINTERIELPSPAGLNELAKMDIITAINDRRSRRRFKDASLTIKELSLLLWATQGIRQRIDAGHALRTVPSAGARHALETYLGILNVGDLDIGLYRYLPLEHQLLVEYRDVNMGDKLAAAAFNQNWMSKSAAIFVWTTVPYRMEWRYELAAYKVILLDAGHVCQNLYLTCEAIGAGACAVAAYDQERMDHLLQLNEEEEFTIYMAAVGKPE